MCSSYKITLKRIMNDSILGWKCVYHMKYILVIMATVIH